MLSDTTPAPPEPPVYRPDEILLYGVKLNAGYNFADIPFDLGGGPERPGIVLRLQAHKAEDAPDARPLGDERVSFVVAYGYAFEGSCYRFDRPRLLLLAPAVAGRKAEGCGFDESYQMWRITSKTMLLDASIATGLAEELILAANLPGNRLPNTYGNHMELAHRSGRLNRGGGS
ncbi:hypothetical protein J2X65_002619 [Ancylobacter sp. 3268]|uniref:hypothetical protein n=1 Tax=Ancylobacter sp. 3268 TaxID=2817752 RepID=UPI00285979A5|nr:hypothetical protein [Ancylobacter sp. 3268]MDR6953258.1 hypothetical protein [Ancylobacter sp. 3268]